MKMPLTELVLPQTANEKIGSLIIETKKGKVKMTKDISFETLDLLATLGIGSKNAKPIALLARQMDITKKRVLKMIANARKELEDTDTLIMNNGRGGFYVGEVQHGGSEDEHIKSLLQLFG